MAIIISIVRRICGMPRAIQLSAVLVAVFLATACGTRPVISIENENLRIPQNASLKQVEQEIIQGAAMRGWWVRSLKPGRLEATLQLRDEYTLVVNVIHTTKTMSISYKDSKNLKYDGTNINNQANKWILNLRKSIVRRTSKLIAREPAPRQTVASIAPTPERPAAQIRQIRKQSTGTGFFVSTNGHILTNFHVVNGCRTAVASTSGMSTSGMISPVGMEVRPKSPTNETLGGGKLTVLAVDRQIDLALLKSTQLSTAVAAFRGGRGVRAGEDIIVTGFPLQGVISSEINVTTGIVSALAGPGNNRGLIQISAPVQPGNSGGPVHDNSGNIVGVVVGKLDENKTRQISGSAPENVNFAISEWAARSFLESHGVQYEMVNSNETTPTADIAAKARQYTVLIKCFK